MALILPAAPQNFYVPSLVALKNNVERINGITKGKITLLTAPPADIEDAWAEVGQGSDAFDLTDMANPVFIPANRGSNVVGSKSVNTIDAPVLGPEQAPGENGYKAIIRQIKNVPIYIDGTGTTTAVIVAMALIEGVDAFALGTPDSLKYLFKVHNLTVTDGGVISLPEIEVIINYSELII